MKVKNTIPGSCLCGGVRFEVALPFIRANHCHCERCRKHSGTAMCTQGRVWKENFRLLRGKNLINVYGKGEGAVKAFCRICGSSLLGGDWPDGDQVSIRLGSLDRDPKIRPQFHTFVGDRAPWDEITDDLPQYRAHWNALPMAAAERARLEKIDAVLNRKEVRAKILSVVGRVRHRLRSKKSLSLAWETIPLTIFEGRLPKSVRSAWVFGLRAGISTGVERHPNSRQRMMSFEGTGDLQTAGRGKWRSNVLISEPNAPLEQRWISIPPNRWHRPVIPKSGDWVVVSFHTATADELIEERPADSQSDRTKQSRYSQLGWGRV